MAETGEDKIPAAEFFSGTYTNEVNPNDPANTNLSSNSLSSNDLSAQRELAKKYKLQNKIANGITKAAAKANEEMNEMLSSMLQPIYDIILQFKGIPPKIRSIVDIDGAANGMYKQLGKVQTRMFGIEKKMISSEVPIELEDYLEDPYAYENLLELEYKNNEVTEEDCLSSGYTKIKWEEIEVKTMEPVDQYPPPQERDIVGRQMEKLVGSTIKHAWQVVKPPINTIASIANIGPIPEMIQSVIDAVDAIVKIASKVIPEEKLDEMLAQKLYAQELAKNEAEKASKKKKKKTKKSFNEKLSDAMEQAQNTISQTYNGIMAGVSESFANFEAPTIPDDVKETIEDFKDAIIMVKDNISNIYIVILLKMMGAVFKCFNQILGVIGVPSIPDPLGKIPQILTDAMSIMKFIMGLPMSLIQCLTAIIKRKMKAIQIALIPTPPLPLPEKKPVPPTSDDVVKPDTTWDDCVDKLVNDYGFSRKDAESIVQDVQDFYDGSDSVSNEGVMVLTGSEYTEDLMGDGNTYVSKTPTFEKYYRTAMGPVDFMQNGMQSMITSKMVPTAPNEIEDIVYELSVPSKSEAPGKQDFYHYDDTEDGKVVKEYDDMSEEFEFGLKLYLPPQKDSTAGVEEVAF